MTALRMSEDQLLTGVTDALTAHGWRWTHHRRSDKALTMGDRGIPDIVAARGGRLLFLELKTDSGVLSPDQLAWLAEFPLNSYWFTALVVRPADYDRLVNDVLR